MSAVSLTNIFRKLDVTDLRKRTLDGGPSAATRIRPWWFNRGKKMYRTRGKYTGQNWPKYRASERQYVAIKASIYRKNNHPFDKQRDLLRWIRSGELLYPSLTDPKNLMAIYRANRKSINAGSRLLYVDQLSRGGVAPKKLGGGVYPARPLLMIKGNAKRDLDRIIRRWAKAQEKGIERMTRNARGL